MRRMNGTSDIDTTRFQRVAVVRQNGARIAVQVVKEAQRTCLWVGEEGRKARLTKGVDRRRRHDATGLHGHADLPYTSSRTTLKLRRSVAMPSCVATSAYCDIADAMSNASVHIPSSRAKREKEKREGGAAVR
jgi:hypothetical protein